MHACTLTRGENDDIEFHPHKVYEKTMDKKIRREICLPDLAGRLSEYLLTVQITV